MATTAGFRSGTGNSPTPTVRASVRAGATAAVAVPR